MTPSPAMRGAAGVVLEAFGVGNMPDANAHGWLPWLQQQTKRGVKVAARPSAPRQRCKNAHAVAKSAYASSAFLQSCKRRMTHPVLCMSAQVYLASQCSTGPLQPELYRR